jgi:ribosomal protein S18 acetylase RimI-like enzyme
VGVSPDPIDIRQATIADLEPLARLFNGYRRFYGQDEDLDLSRSFLRARFEHQQSVVFMATDPKAGAVGFVQLYPAFSSVAAARIFILSDLFVGAEARRCGIGARLVEAAAAYARAVGAIRLSLTTALDNQPAQALYLAQAWERDTEHCLLTLDLES